MGATRLADINVSSTRPLCVVGYRHGQTSQGTFRRKEARPMRSSRINLSLNEPQAQFYLAMLREYQLQRDRRLDKGVAQDIMFLETEMEMRGWEESK